MDKLKITNILANCALIYILTCIFYFVLTRNIGTPFYDAVNKDAELMKIKKESSRQRGNIFYTGLLISILLIIIFRPL